VSLICCYFQVHQPERLAHFSVFDVGRGRPYGDDQLNGDVCRRVAAKCYRPTNALLLRLIHDLRGRFKVAFSVSGVAVEQLRRYAPDVIDGFRALADTGCVEFLAETYWHSLSFLFSRAEFNRQVADHHRLMMDLFGQGPRVFRNTELIYSNALARAAEELGYQGVLADGIERILGWRSPNYVYRPVSTERIRVLLKNYRLSDDIAFRFSAHDWVGWPLTAERFAAWLAAASLDGPVLNLFLDYETFGEHQWPETGIFQFLERMPYEVLRHRDLIFATPSEVVRQIPPAGELDCHWPISWADAERDTSAWLGNDLQRNAAEEVYRFTDEMHACPDPALVADWRRLQTSDHFYYMSTKGLADGTVHHYFTPYDSPYECYIAYMNVLNDLEQRVKALGLEVVGAEV
jgi:alpha-amylase